jgi:hypothetical protein
MTTPVLVVGVDEAEGCAMSSKGGPRGARR